MGENSTRLRPQARKEQLLALLTQRGRISFSEASQLLGVSEMTIRRDIELLEASGQVDRVSGGALFRLGRSVEPDLLVRSQSSLAAKQAIARAAVEFISNQSTVALGYGTTIAALASELCRSRLNLTVSTMSLTAAVEIAKNPGIRVVLPGGTVRANEPHVVGAETESFFGKYHWDIALTTIAGISAAAGLTDFDLDDARVNGQLMAAADRTIVLADQSKLGRVSFAPASSLASISTLITDAPANHPEVQAITEAGVKVLSVTVPAQGA